MVKGTDSLMDTAMITLRTSDLLLLPKVFRLSRQTVSLMYRNLFWAFIYNTVGIFVAAGVLYPVYDILLSPALAGAVMALSCVSVALSSLRLSSRFCRLYSQLFLYSSGLMPMCLLKYFPKKEALGKFKE